MPPVVPEHVEIDLSLLFFFFLFLFDWLEPTKIKIIIGVKSLNEQIFCLFCLKFQIIFKAFHCLLSVINENHLSVFFFFLLVGWSDVSRMLYLLSSSYLAHHPDDDDDRLTKKKKKKNKKYSQHMVKIIIIRFFPLSRGYYHSQRQKTWIFLLLFSCSGSKTHTQNSPANPLVHIVVIIIIMVFRNVHHKIHIGKQNKTKKKFGFAILFVW